MWIKAVLGFGVIASLTSASAADWIEGKFDSATSGRPSSDDIAVVDNIAPLKKVVASSASTIANHRRFAKRADSPTQGNALLTNAYDSYYIVNITLNNQTLPLQIDTGSSDTWLVQQNFLCEVDPAVTETPSQACGFAPGYNGTLSDIITNDTFVRSYDDGTFALGFYGFADVGVAGLTAPHQELALVNDSYWSGDGQTVGLMGLAYPLMTELSGTTQVRQPYDPIFTNLWKRNIISPMFSVALSREGGNSSTNASYIAFGGLPPVDYNASTWTSTPLQNMSVLPQWDLQTSEMGFYTFTADAYWLGNKTSLAHNPIPYPVVVDVGSTLTILPSGITERLYQSFDPPGTYDDWSGAYYVPCNATAPTFGMQLGKQILYMSTVDLIRQDALDSSGTLCRIGVAEDDEGPWVIGDTFLTSLVAVFDVGNSSMRFAARNPY